MISKLENISESVIKLFVKRNGVEQQAEIPVGESIIVDTYETPTIRVFKKRGFITMEPVENIAEVYEAKKSTPLNETIDNTIDPNNDEPMDHFHTTETHQVVAGDNVVISTENNDYTVEENQDIIEVVEGEVKQYVENGFIKGAWSEEDEDFLKKNYPTKGRTFCANHLNRNESSVQKKINSLGLKKKKKKKK